MDDQEPESCDLPPVFLERLKSIVAADQLESVIDSFSADKPTTFRLNTLQATRDEILTELNSLDCPVEPVPWLADDEGPIAFKIPSEFRKLITHSKIIDEGKIYVQNLSSMLAPLILDPQPGETILDLAAAPGGKTTQIAQMMKNDGVLSAVEPIRNRMFKLRSNLLRCGVEITKIYQMDGRLVGRKTPERFDRVLLDAPCSSEARFRTGEPKSWETWSPRKIRETSRKQIGLLKAAIHATKVGGRILYCTCSFSPEENELVLNKTLRKFSDAVEVLPVQLPIGNCTPGVKRVEKVEFGEWSELVRRILPNEVMDGFFVSLLKKTAPTTKQK